jgi:acyl-CoA thioesterase FadM
VSEPDTFRLDLAVAGEDLDSLGHASNIARVWWIQEGAMSQSTSVGVGLEAYSRLGGGFVVGRPAMDCMRPALRGDALEARTWISSVTEARW